MDVNFSHILQRYVGPDDDTASLSSSSSSSWSSSGEANAASASGLASSPLQARVASAAAPQKLPRNETSDGANAKRRRSAVDEQAVDVVVEGEKEPSSPGSRGGRGHKNSNSSSSGSNHSSTLEETGGRIMLKAHVDLDDDTVSLRAYWDAMFDPTVYMKVFYALRITLMVGLPLAIFARMPKMQPKFPAHVVLPLWGIVDCKYTVGEQLAQSIVSLQCGIITMIWGCLNNAWGLLHHHSAWWCAVIFIAFFVSLFGDVRGRRLFVLQCVLILQMENLAGGTELIFPVKVGRDMIMSTGFAFFQVFFPPKTVARECDALFAAAWKEMGSLIQTAVKAIWSDDPIESAIAISRLSTDPLQHIFAVMPGRLFFVMYEPWESTLRLELRKERLELMKLCTPRLHALAAATRMLVMKRVFTVYDDAKRPTSGSGAASGNGPSRAAHDRHSSPPLARQQQEQQSATRRSADTASREDAEDEEMPLLSREAADDKGSSRDRRDRTDIHSPLSVVGEHEPFSEHPRGGESPAHGAKKPLYTTARQSVSKLSGVHERNGEYIDTDELKKSLREMGHPHSDEDVEEEPHAVPAAARHRVSDMDRARLRKEMAHLRQERLGVQYDMERQLRKFGKEIVFEPLHRFLDCLQDVLTGLGQHLNPTATAEKVPFDALQDASAELEAALNKMHFELLVKSEKRLDPLVYSTTIFFHLSLIVLAERLVEYGHQMRNFNRARYKSQWQRMWEFFFYDYWRNFFEAVPSRLTLATPRDVRILKDAIKMACAYGLGVMFTEYTDTKNVYYFGMAILMGVGWPTAGDTMVASVYRVTGMVIACSMAYMAIWHTHNLTQEIALALAGVFVASIFRDVPPYSHTAMYASMLICTALNSASTKLVLLSRIVSNTFTVVTYYAICVFFFPIDVRKETRSSQIQALFAINNRFSALVDVMAIPIKSKSPEQQEVTHEILDRILKDRRAMWMSTVAFSQWLPKAAAEPTVIGLPYPIAQLNAVHTSLRRLAAVTDIQHAALQQLHRPSVGAQQWHASDVSSMMAAVVPCLTQIDRRGRVVMQDFIDSFARPYHWSPETATRHFSEFLLLSNDLHKAFHVAHRRNTRAMRQHFRDGVMNRTFAAAQMANLLEPGAAEAATALLRARGKGPAAAAAPGGSRGAPSNGSSQTPHGTPMFAASPAAGRRAVSSLSHSPLGVSAAGNTLPGDATPTYHRTMDEGADEEADEYGEGHRGDVPAVARGSVAKSIVGALTRLDSSGPTGLKTPHASPLHPPSAATTATAATTTACGREGHPLADGSAAADPPGELTRSFVFRNPSMTSRDFHSAILPMEREAEDEEYRLFVAKRKDPQFRLQPEHFSVSHDVNAVISLLVAADIYFCEAEKLVKTMYPLNSYARSRRPKPGSSAFDMETLKKID